MDDDRIEKCKRKLRGLDYKVRELKSELETKELIKIKSPLEDSGIEENISYLKDWIEFYSKEIEKYNAKLRELREQVKKSIDNNQKGDETKTQIKEPEVNIEEKSVKTKQLKGIILNTKDLLIKLQTQKPLVKYIIPFAVLLLIISGLFLFKPGITGYVIAEKEKTYSENLNLKVNESGEYNWTMKNPGNIWYLKASGSVLGNGAIKVYIEKEGKKYLVYSNE